MARTTVVALDPPNTSSEETLVMKIRATPGFNLLERETLQRALLLNQYSKGHLYPCGCSPTSSVYAEITWGILDRLAPDVLTVSQRFMIGEMVTNALRFVHRGDNELS